MYDDGDSGNSMEVRLGGIVSDGIWRVFSCPVNMLGIGINGNIIGGNG